ncbi:2-dehydropantoate 2-reductase N-terminal domain-containing protein [Paenibacillus algorifonticola]|uniref:ketopantoate reductase family protein n=1 Tax=Paenibacillus algorifonticola TaxID=684063 RepID=UPI003D2D56E5
MKILVYGAGVLGSYLAHVLVQGGNDVTVLARGSRAEELSEDGLVIRHYFQRKTTVDKVKVIQALPADDSYDLIFVVMNYNNFPEVLPILAKNKSSHIVFVGNNPTASTTEQELLENSLPDKKVAFGFQLSGGRREKGRMICVRGGGQMVLGSLNGPVPFKDLIDKAFAAVKYKIDYHEQIDAWLKSHIVPILVLSSVSYVKDNQFKLIAKDKKLLLQMIAAVDEGFKVMEAIGYTITPASQVHYFRRKRQLVYFFLKIYHRLPVAKMIDGSFVEIAHLHKTFDVWKQQARIATPNWNELEEAFLAKMEGKANERR